MASLLSLEREPKTCLVNGAQCDLCMEDVAVGDKIWPVDLPSVGDGLRRRAKGRYNWVHAEPCARIHLGGKLVAPPCSRLVQKGNCAYGLDCFYSHSILPPLSAQLPSTTPPSSTSGTVVNAPGQGWASTKKRRKKKGNASKCTVLRRWLLDTFGGVEGLKGSGGVVDVAGGSGELGFELVNLHGVPCVVVEPQPALRLSRFQKAHCQRNAYARNPLFAQHVDLNWVESTRRMGGLPPDHLRCFFDDSFAAWLFQKDPVDDLIGAGTAVQQQHQQHGAEGAPHSADSTVDGVDQRWLDEHLREANAMAKKWAGFGHDGMEQRDEDDAGQSIDREEGKPTEDDDGDDDGGGKNYERGFNPCKTRNTGSHDIVGWRNESNSAAQKRSSPVESDDGADPVSRAQAPQPNSTTAGTATTTTHQTLPASHSLPLLAPRLLTAASHVRARLRKCAVVVGLHPDQATEPLVDFALRARLPFAVVPCCVHAKKRPASKTCEFESNGGKERPANNKSGEELTSGDEGAGGGLHASGVRTYEAFVSYLVAKSPKLIKRVDLPIGGRCTVLYVTSYP